jgi:cell wall assembly regulator SMI1
VIEKLNRPSDRSRTPELIASLTTQPPLTRGKKVQFGEWIAIPLFSDSRGSIRLSIDLATGPRGEAQGQLIIMRSKEV